MLLHSRSHLRQTSGCSGVYDFATGWFPGLSYLAKVKHSVQSWISMSEVVRPNLQIVNRAIRPWRASVVVVVVVVVVVEPPVDCDDHMET